MDPIVFTPYLRPMVWGGRRLGDVLGKPLPPDGTWASRGRSATTPRTRRRVAEGPLAGARRHSSVSGTGASCSAPLPAHDAFPLLVKYLDANDWLSVQVHPDDDQAMAALPASGGKTEAWFVLTRAQAAASTPG